MVSVETLLLHPQPVLLSAGPTTLKEWVRGTSAELVRQVRVVRSLFKKTKSYVSSVAKRVKDRPATLDAEGPSCRERKLLPQLSPTVRRCPDIDSRSAKQNSRCPGSTKNSNRTANRRPKGEGNSVAGLSDIGTDGCADTNLAAKRVKCVDAFHTELISKLDVVETKSKVSHIDLQVLKQLVRDKKVRPIFEHILAAHVHQGLWTGLRLRGTCTAKFDENL